MKISIGILLSLGLVVSQQDKFRIVGGVPARPNTYPFAAYMVQRRTGSLCGASLLSNSWLVTAAHCVHRTSPGDIRVTVGQLTFDPNSGSEIQRIVIHPGYETQRQTNDIALIQLRDTVDFTPIKIETETVGDNEDVRAVGWGLMYSSATRPASTLQEVDLKTMPRDDCRSRLPTFEGNGVGKQLCTGNTPGRDTCSGDSGGPLMRRSGNEWKLIGLTSFGAWDNRITLTEVCGIEEIVGIYTNVYKYLDFISDSTGISKESLT
ncbi:hypothetical protein BB559_005789 [Furculomyces boomerangus]|uniref:Peptidase S1 domain-containing protein n=2 Tax=Harpellales TaxID=61421 RepID=A0A2T9Y6L3_9FUNG|nr:hypothetical protein BB559_005789 [Furculomyces boomerangus]PVZ99517.1 hypothetical protein BB558_004541 [Smittium angustum]